MPDPIHDILLSEIQIDGDTQLRKEVFAWRIADLKAAFTNDEPVEPIILFRDATLKAGKKYWIGDGHQRTGGCKASGRKSIKAVIYDGSKRDAILFAASANSKQDKNGLPRSNEDKRYSVRKLLEDAEWGTRSLNWIAEACAVSHGFVTKVKEGLSGSRVGTCTEGAATVTGQDGKEYPASKGDTAEEAKNGKPKKPPKLGDKPTKAGAEVIDWLHEFKSRFGPLVRFQDDIVREGQGHPDEKCSGEYYAYGRLIKELLACAERWWKKIKGTKKARK